MLLTGGRIVDPRNGVDAVLDLAIEDGRVVEVGPSLPARRAAQRD